MPTTSGSEGRSTQVEAKKTLLLFVTFEFLSPFLWLDNHKKVQQLKLWFNSPKQHVIYLLIKVDRASPRDINQMNVINGLGDLSVVANNNLSSPSFPF